MDRARRMVVSGMAINVPLGDTLDTFYENLIAGKSAITRWRFEGADQSLSKIGGDLTGYDTAAKIDALAARLPADVVKRLRRLVKKAPFSTQLTMLCAADGMVDAGLAEGYDPDRIGVVVGGHNLGNNLVYRNNVQFTIEPEYIDSMLALHGLDTDQAACVGEAMGLHGPVYTMGGACASANLALRNALDEIRYHDLDVMIVAGAVLDFSPVDLQAMAIMGAISYQHHVDEPHRASRPYDVDRAGFLPAHGTGVLVIEELEHARRRGARIYAEVLGVSTASDGSHLPAPSVDGQVRTMRHLLASTGVRPEEVDYVSAHATSTPLGDVTEIRSIKEAFGAHAHRLKINATKSMLGHTCWAAPATETVAALLQMQHGTLHPSINVDRLDPEVDLDVCANQAVKHPVRTLMKNSFGFGGINCCSLFRKLD